MAVTKIWKVKGRIADPIAYAVNPEKTQKKNFSKESLQAMEDVMNYAVNEEKTEKMLFVTGINCDPKSAREEFTIAKQSFGKEDGIIAYHAYQSFEAGETTPEQAHEIGVALARRLWGDDYQVIVATHLNTQCLHNHFVVNSVSFLHGKRCRKTQWQDLRRVSDELCKEYGLSVVEKPRGRGLPYPMYQAEKAGLPTRLNMAKQAIDTAVGLCKTMPELIYTLRTMGYYSQFNPNRRYWTIRQKNWKQPIRLARLGDDYSNESILARLEANPESVRIERFQGWRKREATLFDKLLWRSSLKNLYLYYCYQLGYFPKKNLKPKPEQVHPRLRDELLKLELITEETDLLVREGINTTEELFTYRDSLIRQMKFFEEERKKLKLERNLKCTTEPRAEYIKVRISEINEELKHMRKDVSRCARIAKRSGVMQKQLTEMEREEKEIQRLKEQR